MARRRRRDAGASAARKRRRRRRRIALLPKILLLLLLASALAWQIHGLRAQVDAARAERDRVSAQVDDARRENEALEADIAAGATDEKMEELARDQLGLARRGAVLFYTGD